MAYYITQKPVSAVKGDLVYFRTFIDPAGDWLDSVHFPQVADRHPLTGKGYYHMRGKVVDDLGVYSVEVTWMKKVGMKRE